MFATLLALAVGAPALKDKPGPALTIEGQWKVASRFDSGKPSTDNNIWIFRPGGGAEIRESAGRHVVSTLTYTLSSAGPVRDFDFLEAQGNGKSDLRRGIYRIEGDTLTVSFTVGDAARPTTFDPSADHYVIALSRVKK
jgi:uncharacterized protein (TIGR03067 family)